MERYQCAVGDSLAFFFLSAFSAPGYSAIFMCSGAKCVGSNCREDFRSRVCGRCGSTRSLTGGLDVKAEVDELDFKSR